jgi:hypothetical protein
MRTFRQTIMVCQIFRSIARFRLYVLRIWSALRRTSVSPNDDPESARGSDESTSFKEIDLVDLDSPADPAGASAIQWILETSTDMDIITTAVQVVPDVEWPYRHNVTLVLNQLTRKLHAYIDTPWRQNRHMREQVLICLKAIFHLYAERGLRGPLTIRNNNIIHNDDHLGAIPDEQDFQLISCVMEPPNDLDITSLPFSDRMWMAHILTRHLHTRNQLPSIRPFVHEFIDKCLCDPKTPSRLVADCLVLAGLMVGLRPRRRYLAKVDKR